MDGLVSFSRPNLILNLNGQQHFILSPHFGIIQVLSFSRVNPISIVIFKSSKMQEEGEEVNPKVINDK
jgi:hypothetical protein